MDRSCGACTLCCTAMAVPELGKPNGVECEHLTPTGCGIYEERPESCRRFVCSWLDGVGDTSVRPDRVGAVMTVEDGGLGDDGMALVLYTKVGDESYKKSKYLSKIAYRVFERGAGVVVVSGDDKTYYSKEGSKFAKVVHNR